MFACLPVCRSNVYCQRMSGACFCNSYRIYCCPLPPLSLSSFMSLLALPSVTVDHPIPPSHHRFQTTKTLLAHVNECSRAASNASTRQACLVCTMAAEPWVAPQHLVSPRDDTNAPLPDDDDDGNEIIFAEEWAGDDDMSTELPIRTHVPSFHSSHRSVNDSMKTEDSTARGDGGEADEGEGERSALAKRTREVRSPSRRPSLSPPAAAAAAAAPSVLFDPADHAVVSEHGSGAPDPLLPPPPMSPLSPGGGRALEKLQRVGEAATRRAVVSLPEALFPAPHI